MQITRWQFLQAVGTGAVMANSIPLLNGCNETDLPDKSGRDTIRIDTYGAVGDATFQYNNPSDTGNYGITITGGTPNDTAIQRALDALPAGGTLIVSNGRFLITRSIIIDKPMSIVGTGQFSYGQYDKVSGLFLNARDRDEAAIEIRNSAQGNVTISNLTMVGTGEFNAAPTSQDMTVRGTGVFLNGSSAKIYRCSFLNLYAGIRNKNAHSCSTQSSNFYHFHYGFYAEGSGFCNIVTILNSQFVVGHYGIFGESGDAEHTNWQIINNVFEYAFCGIRMRTRCANISGNWFERLGTGGDPHNPKLIGGPMSGSGAPIDILSKAMYWRGATNICPSSALDLNPTVGICSIDEHRSEAACEAAGGTWVPTEDVRDVDLEFFEPSFPRIGRLRVPA